MIYIAKIDEALISARWMILASLFQMDFAKQRNFEHWDVGLDT